MRRWISAGVLVCACGSSDAAPDASASRRDAGPTDASAADRIPHDAPAHDSSTLKEGGGTRVEAGSLCGNGVLDPGEQCDDGNHYELDGCDATCHFEVLARMSSVQIAGTTAPAGCTPTTNRFGTQFVQSAALGEINMLTASDVTTGQLNVILQFLKLSDLTGGTAAGFQIGLLNATADPAKGTWPTSGNPEDWWFLALSLSVSDGLPTGIFMVTDLSQGVLTAGPTTVNLGITLEGSVAEFTLRDAHIFANIDTTPPPDVPSPPPGKLAPGIEVFQTITASGTNQGLCGNITVASLAQVPIPTELTTGASACEACAGSNVYTACAGNTVTASCNSLLDVVVGGCVVGDCFLTGLAAQQPDVPAMSGGTVQPLSLDGTTHKVTQDVAMDFDGYSSYFLFNATRAHFTGQTCDVTAECQTGQTCTAGVCED
jgi:cysteine-rich repeat protein